MDNAEKRISLIERHIESLQYLKELMNEYLDPKTSDRRRDEIINGKIADGLSHEKEYSFADFFKHDEIMSGALTTVDDIFDKKMNDLYGIVTILPSPNKKMNDMEKQFLRDLLIGADRQYLIYYKRGNLHEKYRMIYKQMAESLQLQILRDVKFGINMNYDLAEMTEYILKFDRGYSYFERVFKKYINQLTDDERKTVQLLFDTVKEDIDFRLHNFNNYDDAVFASFIKPKKKDNITKQEIVSYDYNTDSDLQVLM